MFAIHCSRHEARVLIWPSLVEAVRNVAGVIEVDYRCTCGHRGTWQTGRGLAARDGVSTPRRTETADTTRSPAPAVGIAAFTGGAA